MNIRIIHIEWDGPYKKEEIFNEKYKEANSIEDFGLYQIYGRHPVYGRSLLYIGQAKDREFSVRIREHDQWINDDDIEEIEIFLGRLYEENHPYTYISKGSLEIEWAESLLIYVHGPAYNSRQEFGEKTERSLQNLLILNWYARGSLLPEVSGARWTNLFPEE